VISGQFFGSFGQRWPLLARSGSHRRRYVGDQPCITANPSRWRPSLAADCAGRAPHPTLGHVPTTSPALPQAAGFSFFAWGRLPAGAAALCVNSHNLPGRDVLSLRCCDSRSVFLGLSPSQMAGFFTSHPGIRPVFPSRTEQGRDQEGRHHHHQAGMAGCT
jgi:hypothetical protein